jgi:hypothetical protein
MLDTGMRRPDGLSRQVHLGWSAHAHDGSVASRQQVAFAGVHVEDGEQRSRPAYIPASDTRSMRSSSIPNPQPQSLLGQLARQTKTDVLLHEQNGAVHPATEAVVPT